MTAMDNLRKVSQDRGEIPPCWLCLSPEAKAEAKADVLKVISDMAGLPLTEGGAETLIKTKISKDLLMRWAEAEAHLKSERKANNPHAWFAK
jgi:hypothetical protein